MPAAATLITSARVLRADGKATDACDVLIENGSIVAIEPAGRITRQDVARIDAADQLLVPGLVNGHTHGHGGLGKGLVEDRVPLEVFLSASGAINGSRTIEDKYLSTQLTAIELVRKGCTAAYDLTVEYPLPSIEGMTAMADAYADVGLRAVLAPMMADHALYDALPGLMEALPPDLRSRAEAMLARPARRSWMRRAPCSPIGGMIEPWCGRPWDPPSRCTARRSS